MKAIFESALREDVKTRIKEIGRVELLVGIPCYNNQDTVGQVLQTAVTGLEKHYPGSRAAVFVSDGGSVDDSREKALGIKIPDSVERIVTIYRGIPGKGSALRAVFEAARSLDCKAVILFDSDLESITPDWVAGLAEPVMSRGADLVIPYYNRHKYDGTITNFIAYPLVRAFFGKRIYQPIGGDFGLSRGLIESFAKEKVWSTDIAKFGIDIWLTIKAIKSDSRLYQSRLGIKVHAPKDPVELGPMFRQVVGTLFSLINGSRDIWPERNSSEEVEFVGTMPQSKTAPIKVSMQELVDSFRYGFVHFGPVWREIMSEDTFERLHDVFVSSREFVEFSHELWARVVYDFVVNYSKWRTDKQKLVGMMTPLYYGRVAAHVHKTKRYGQKQAFREIEMQAEAFDLEKSYFLERASALFGVDYDGPAGSARKRR